MSEKRTCACGCGVRFAPGTFWQRYATDACKMRAYRARKAKRDARIKR